MSWKGFQRGVIRAPQTVRSRFNMGEVTKDEVYIDAERRFVELEKETKKLQEESKKYAESIQKMLSHQIEFSKALADLYKPISGRPSDPNSYKDEGNPEGIQACEQYEEIVRDLQSTLAPELETIETRIISPATQLLDIMKAIRKTATKRDHKQLDYDRHRTTLTKLQEKKDKTIKDEKAIYKAEADLEQATQDYNYFNELLKEELPQFFDLERKFIRPLFTSMYYLQLNIFYTMDERMRNLNIDYFDWSTDVEEGYERRAGDHKDKIDKLTISSFKSSGGFKRGESKYGNKLAKDKAEQKAAQNGRPQAKNPEDSNEPPPPPYSADADPGTVVATSSSATAPPSAAAINKLAAAAKSKPPPPKPKPMRLSGKPAVETVTALYDYEVQAHTDLGFSAGDVIEIVTRTPNENEWWTGKLNGKTGQFPGNYVKLNT